LYLSGYQILIGDQIHVEGVLMADRLGRWTAADVPDQSRRTAVVTGASGGLGLETAEVLAWRGAAVVLACRDLGKAEGAAERIRQHSGNADVRVVHLDLASMASVRAAADEIRDACPSLDLLINNAGVMNIPRELTEDGFERTLGTNHLGHFALTGLLLGRLTGTGGSRVVTVSSNGHREGDGVMHFEDLQFERGYKPWPAYYRSKLANLLFTYELQRRLAVAGAGPSALAAHPGNARTDLWRHSRLDQAVYQPSLRMLTFWFAQSARMGALATLRAATDPAARGGEYYGPPGRQQFTGYPIRVASSSQSHDEADAARLWAISEELTGVSYSALAPSG
jgi:NAD(P)-dependent dehydrogenase (short-subunit alcohol dehydrogenase family)